MKNTIISLFTLLTISVMSLSAQTNSLTVSGKLDIVYNTRQSASPQKGVKDVYTLNVNVANSALFHGTITDQPQIIEGFISKSVVQPRRLDYDIGLDVVNPKNPTQTKNVGKMIGYVPIASDGAYLYDKGTLEVGVLPMGNAGGFTSKFTGIAMGKPMGRPANWLETLQSKTVNITRSVNGKITTVALKKYDKMEFRQYVLAAGPVQIYQTVTVNGEMLYDYEKECWFFNNFSVQYADSGVIKIDRITGTIRWDKTKNEYQFDVRVNEPATSVDAAFSAPTDESAFFETDTKIPSLTGNMKYKDSVRNGVTMSSSVVIDLVGNSINKQQLMVLSKLIVFSAVVPMNSD